ncbi:MAG TPA: geranylgeranylglyceryl/heptaprenylglyceryl phosphate synthase [Flavobacterium sp.]|nr:geranylgeranylglyceryl/heptaprenylglyceryl phosphate synthase [Flavobacterium sp.]
MSLYQDFLNSKKKNQRLLAILIDPEKTSVEDIPVITNKIEKSPATHILIGGSTYNGKNLDNFISILKKELSIPVILFPGNFTQISDLADGILFLSLISGRNPDFLIENQVKAAPVLKKLTLEIIPTGYLLIDGSRESAVSRVSKTTPILNNDIETAVNTALAGEMLGMKLVYLEAGSGAKNPVSSKMITAVKKQLSVPLIVGGGITSQQQLNNAFEAGADLIVIGTAFENDINFFDKLTL